MAYKILIVDDDESIRLLFQEFLESAGYDVALAEDFDDAQALINSRRFDLVYADIVLSGRTGLDLLKIVKDRNPNCPVVIVTGKPRVETSAEAVRCGAFDYITKPVRLETLRRVTEMALQHKALMDERESYRKNLEAIFRGIRDVIFLMDKDLTVVEVNDSVKSVCDHDRNEIVGKLIYSLPISNKEFSDAVRETIITGQPVDINRIECKLKNRHTKTISVSTTPLVDPQGDFSGAVLVVRDETRLDFLEKELGDRRQFHNIVGKSVKMQEVYALVESLAKVDSTVLITGESGTGKELLAEAIHHKGDRREKPLLKVNCSALTDSLLESELFGHVKGAFTGATNDRIGRFQAAEGGTIFLDEIGDISQALQRRLLRVLQTREIERVGESTPRTVDVRVIAATNRDLRKLMFEGKFREDLYYRIKVVEIIAPPLRERRDDIPLLVEHFMNKLNKRLQKSITGFSEEVLRKFMSYSWPGNIRQLEHAIEHALVVCHKDVITLDNLPDDLFELVPPEEDIRELGVEPTNGIVGTDMRQRILSALAKTGWNKAGAAKLLGISRRTIYRKLKELGIDTSRSDA